MKKNWLKVSAQNKNITLFSGERALASYPVSLAKNGFGEQNGSECTPRGWHCVRAMIGRGNPLNTVYVARRPTGEIFSRKLYEKNPQRDWILTRIIWLSGLEPGKNRLGTVDSMQRYIYIHGCPEQEPITESLSHGCIRMTNQDIIELFNLIDVGSKILITTD